MDEYFERAAGGAAIGVVGDGEVALTRAMLGLTGFSAANYMQTVGPGGGEPGVSTGFAIVALVQLNAMPTAGYTFSTRSGGASEGYFFVMSAAGSLTMQMKATAAFPASPSFQFVASDVGKLHCVVGLFTGAGALLRMLVDRVERGTGTAMVGYVVPSAVKFQMSAFNGANQPVNGMTILADSAFQGVPSDPQLQAYFDAARVLGDLPDTIGGATVTHLWSAKRELAGTTVVNGQTAPAQLTDRVTAATADALVRVSTGLDIRNDANSIRGLGPFSATDYLQSSLGGGIQGSNTFWVQVDVWPTAIPATAQDVVSCMPSGQTTGWDLRFSGAGQIFGVLGAGAVVTFGIYTIVSGDLNKRMRIVINKTATVAQLWVNGVQIGSDVAATTYNANPANTIAMIVGAVAGGVRPFVNGYVEMVQGGSATNLTTGEIAALNADLTTAAPSVAGKTQKRHIFEQDIAAAPTFGVPTSSVERISGGDSLYRFGGPMAVKVIDPTIDGRRTLGAQGFSLSNYYQGVVAAGLSGSATGFWAAVVVQFSSVSSANEVLASFSTAGGAGGWSIMLLSTTIRGAINGQSYTANVALAATDVGRPILLVLNHSGSQASFYKDRAQVGASNASGYTASPTGAMGLGCYGAGGGAPAGTSSVFGMVGGNLVGGLTFAQVTQLYDEFAATGTVPTLSGVATHRYDLTADILASGVDAVPATVLDRVGTDNLTRSGTGLTLAQRTERVWSYETAPILYGVDTFTDADYYSVLNGFPGAAAGWWACLPFVVTSQSVASRARNLVGCETAGGVTGFSIRTTGTNTLLAVFMANGAGTSTAGPSVAIAAADVGKVLLAFVCWDGTKLHLWVKRAEVGTGTAITGYLPAATGQTLFLGKGVAGSVSADGVQVLGLMGGNAVCSLAEVQAAHDAFLAADDLIAIPGKTDLFVSVKQDALANGGSIPSTLTDRVGGKSLAKAGSPTLFSRYARAAGW